MATTKKFAKLSTLRKVAARADRVIGMCPGCKDAVLLRDEHVRDGLDRPWHADCHAEW